jgi:hypothetical protein
VTVKHLLRLFLIAAVVATVFTFAAVRPAAAAGCTVLDVIAIPGYPFYFHVTEGHVYSLYRNGVFVVSVTYHSTGQAGWVFADTSHYVLIDTSVVCGVFFNPGDGRVDPRPGDRVVAYCGATTLDVWGVTNDSVGHRLFTFNKADLVKAGASGILKNVEPMGSVFAAVSAEGVYTVQWFGGPAGATGTKDFAKTFTCPQ